MSKYSTKNVEMYVKLHYGSFKSARLLTRSEPVEQQLSTFKTVPEENPI